MGWASRANPIAQEHPRTKRLRTLCKVMPRSVVMDLLPKLTEEDRLIVLAMLDDVQPMVSQ